MSSTHEEARGGETPGQSSGAFDNAEDKASTVEPCSCSAAQSWAIAVEHTAAALRGDTTDAAVSACVDHWLRAVSRAGGAW